jgi:hypothetical protein
MMALRSFRSWLMALTKSSGVSLMILTPRPVSVLISDILATSGRMFQA